MSTSVSPLETDEPDAATFTVSALRRFSANSKEMRVRVDGSKKQFTTVLPRSSESVTRAPSRSVSVNSGAGSPTAIEASDHY